VSRERRAGTARRTCLSLGLLVSWIGAMALPGSALALDFFGPTRPTAWQPELDAYLHLSDGFRLQGGLECGFHALARGQAIDVNFIADTGLQPSRSWTPIISVILSSFF
jgi:hypothetical protein